MEEKREEKESGERGYWALSWSLTLKPHPYWEREVTVPKPVTSQVSA